MEAPDAAAALAAVAALRDQVADAYQAGDRLDAPSCARLAGQLIQLAEHAHWARDAALAIARHSGASWPELAAATGVPDATLYNRLTRFLELEES